MAGETGEEKAPELRMIGGGARGEERRVIHEECLILISSQEHLLTWSYLAWLSFCLISFSIIHHK